MVVRKISSGSAPAEPRGAASSPEDDDGARNIMENMDSSLMLRDRRRPHGNGDGSDDDSGSPTSPLTGKSAKPSIASQKYQVYEIRRNIFLRIAGAILLVVAVILLAVVIYLARKQPEIQYCAFQTDVVTQRDYKNPDVFDDLTPGEFNAVKDFMLGDPDLGLTPFDTAVVNSSYILVIDLHLPPKAEVIQYLDKESKKPQREAKVVVVRGNTIPPRVDEYIVSDLRRPKTLSWTLYKNPSYRRQPIPYTSRMVDVVDYRSVFKVIKQASETMYPLLMESFGLCYHNCTKDENCIIWYDFAPRGRKSGERNSWTLGFPHVDGWYLHPLGIELLIDHRSTDVSKWKVEKIVYNGHLFDSVDSIMTAYKEKKLKLIHQPKGGNMYSSFKARGDLPKAPIQGPKLTEPEGKRFSVHGSHISYKGWSFYVRMRASTGMQIFDVNFNGNRIAYEISLQEVLVFYTGYGPAQSNTNYYDASWFLGVANMELAKGIDCPDTAVFLDTYFFANDGRPSHTKNNICIFENNPNIPLRRHFAYDVNSPSYHYRFYGGMTDYSLVVRTVANVWNYDYIFDYVFHLNGAIEIRATATGYVQATFLLPQEVQYGGVMHDHVMADLHQHVFNYKLDLDIAGTKNRFSTLDIGLHTNPDPWRKAFNRTNMFIKHSLKSFEKDCLQIDPQTPSYHIVHNKDALNSFGATRGYRIYNKSPMTFLSEGVPEAKAAFWANYPILVTKRKDEEQMSTSIYAQNEPWDPVLDFADFIADNESIVDEDLVAWVTMGVQHIPGTEDIPSTPTVWNHFTTFLTPHNFLDEDPSIHSADNVYIQPTKDGIKVDSYGTSFQSTCIPKFTGPMTFNGTNGVA